MIVFAILEVLANLILGLVGLAALLVIISLPALVTHEIVKEKLHSWSSVHNPKE